ncbi:hypothetical protein LOK49_LG11G00049 [Camellia lanceoleosa]|uniref:Uncharacterized protein n=1 Tax=Camellia lanceoleosa TaxID=1840588 RepID=A0ACC0G3Q5_9ERIC|nr:hypothetical protein LOK49_LG11G00049 [Camellia lanceoleosa]
MSILAGQQRDVVSWSKYPSPLSCIQHDSSPLSYPSS